MTPVLRRLRTGAATVWSILWGALKWFLKGRGTRDAAQVSFFLLLALPALLMVVVWALGGILDDADVRSELIDEIMRFLPIDEMSGRNEVESLLEDIASGAGGLGGVAVIGLVYSISGGIGGLRYAIETAANVASRRDYSNTLHRPFLYGKPLDFAVTLIFLPVVLVLSGLAIGTPVFENVDQDFPLLSNVNQLLTTVLPISLGLGVGLLTLMMRLLSPSRAKLGWWASFTGAAVAVLGLILVVVGLQIYFTVFPGRSAVYGAIASLLTVIFSINVAAMAVIYAAYVATRVQGHLRIHRHR